MSVMRDGPASPGRKPAALAPELRAMLPRLSGVAAVLLPEIPALRLGRRRRLAETLLEDAARIGGGALYRTGSGQTLLCGAAPAVAERAAAGLARLLGTALAATLWRLPEDAAELLAWAAPEAVAARPAEPATDWSAVAELTARLDAVQAERALKAEPILGPDGAGLGRRIRLDRATLAEALAPLDRDRDLLAHAEERLASRLLPGLGAWAAAGAGLRLVPLPARRLPPATQSPGAVGVVPLGLVGQAGLAAQRARLAGLGWQIAIAGIGAAALGVLRPLALPADLLLLRWSGEMAERAAVAALRAVPPARLLLTGADAEGRDWARRLGIGLVGEVAA